MGKESTEESYRSLKERMVGYSERGGGHSGGGGSCCAGGGGDCGAGGGDGTGGCDFLGDCGSRTRTALKDESLDRGRKCQDEGEGGRRGRKLGLG